MLIEILRSLVGNAHAATGVENGAAHPSQVKTTRHIQFSVRDFKPLSAGDCAILNRFRFSGRDKSVAKLSAHGSPLFVIRTGGGFLLRLEAKETENRADGAAFLGEQY